MSLILKGFDPVCKLAKPMFGDGSFYLFFNNGRQVDCLKPVWKQSLFLQLSLAPTVPPTFLQLHISKVHKKPKVCECMWQVIKSISVQLHHTKHNALRGQSFPLTVPLCLCLQNSPACFDTSQPQRTSDSLLAKTRKIEKGHWKKQSVTYRAGPFFGGGLHRKSSWAPLTFYLKDSIRGMGDRST